MYVSNRNKEGITVDPEFETELLSIMHTNTSVIKEKEPEGSFRRILWDQQLQTMKEKIPQRRRWHPAVIRWCLHLKFISSKAYDAVRSSGFLTLPTERTLRDYTHVINSRVGFQADINEELSKIAKVDDCEEYEKSVGIIFDEMKTKDKLVFDKRSGKVSGWVDLADFNSELLKIEKEIDSRSDTSPSVATHILVFMVRGIFLHSSSPWLSFQHIN